MEASYFLKYAISFALTIVFLSNTNSASSQMRDLSTFEDRLLGIRFEYPSDWREGISSDTLFYDSLTSKPTLKLVLGDLKPCKEGAISCYSLRPEINIKIFEVTLPVRFTTLDDYAKEQIRKIQEQLSGTDNLSNGKNYRLGELNATTLAGKRAIVHVFSYTSTLLNFPDPKDNQLLQMDVYMVNTESANNQKLYKISYLATGEEYAKYLSAMKQIISTFQLIPLIG